MKTQRPFSTLKLDGRRKKGVYTGMFDGSKPILPLKPISETRMNDEQERIESIKKRKLEERLKKTSRNKTKRVRKVR